MEEDEKIKIDLGKLCEKAVTLGVSRVRIIETDEIVIDSRIQLKCQYPPCIHYGKNLMCPPFTPKAEEFEKQLRTYRYGIIVQVEQDIPDILRPYIYSKEVTLANFGKERKLQEIRKSGIIKIWRRLYDIVSAIEREAFGMSYYLSLGLIAGTCRLCETCDINAPCKRPWGARPSMESLGIDVYRTAKNANMEIKWNPKSKEKWILNGLILVI